MCCRPRIAVPLVLICSIVAQTSTLPSIWRTIDFSLVWPFLIGGLAGVPLGTLLIAHADPHVFKLSIGVLLLVFPAALYFNRTPMAFTLRRPGGRRGNRICRRHPWRPGRSVRPASDLVGQRARLGQGRAARRFPDLQLDHTDRVAVPAGGNRASSTREVLLLALLAFPATLLGAWLGARTYRALSDRNFRDVVLGLLFLSGHRSGLEQSSAH